MPKGDEPQTSHQRSFKPFKGKAQPSQAKHMLTKVLENLGIKERLIEFELMKLWAEVAGDKLAKDTFAYRIVKSKTLVIGVNTAVLANELQFLKQELKAKFNKLAQQRFNRNINDIIFELRQIKPQNTPNIKLNGLLD